MSVALRNGLKLGGSLIVTWSVAMIVKLQVPAHLGPVRQGHYGFAESIATGFFTFISLGIDTYLMKEASVRPQHASEVVGGVFALRTLMSVVILAAMVGMLVVTHRPTELVVTAMVFGLAQIIMTANTTLTTVLQAVSRVGRVAVANVTTKIVWGLGLLVGLHFDAPLPILAVSLPAAELMKTAMLVPAAQRDAKLRYRIDVAAVKRAVFESLPYFVNSLALGLLGSLGISTLEFVGKDPREVGWFAADQNLCYLCMLLTPLLSWVVMPMISRAHARSAAESMVILRRSLEGLVILIAPVTLLTSAGAGWLVHLAFGEKFAPAAMGLSVLSLVFVLTYADTLLALGLTVMGKGWSVTLVSIGSVAVNAVMMILFVPLGRKILGEGGECAGAATAVILTEVCVFAAMLSRYDESPLDRRTGGVIAKSIVATAGVLFVDHRLGHMGPPLRLVIDAVLYTVVAFGLRIVRPMDVRRVLQVVRTRNSAVVPAVEG